MLNRLRALTLSFAILVLATAVGMGTTSAALKDSVVVGQQITAFLPNLLKWKDVSTAGGTVAAITTTGRLFTWGENTYGTVGDGTTNHRYTPFEVVVNGVSGWTDVEGGTDHMVAVASNGALYTWGRNNVGQLGDGTTTDRHAPTLIRSGNFFAVSVWDNTSVALDRTSGVNGNPYAWGENRKIAASNTPTRVGTANLRTIDVGADYAVGLSGVDFMGGHYMRMWGSGLFGTRSIGSTVNGTTLAVATAGDWVSISTYHQTGEHRSVLRNTGGNAFGQLKSGDTTSSTVISPASSIPGVLFAGDNITDHVFGALSLSAKGGIAHVTPVNRTFVWGDNTWGQHGNGTTTHPGLSATTYLGFYTASSLGQLTGDPHSPVTTAVIDPEGRLFVWGHNEYGQVGNGSTSLVVTTLTEVQVAG